MRVRLLFLAVAAFGAITAVVPAHADWYGRGGPPPGAYYGYGRGYGWRPPRPWGGPPPGAWVARPYAYGYQQRPPFYLGAPPMLSHPFPPPRVYVPYSGGYYNY